MKTKIANPYFIFAITLYTLVFIGFCVGLNGEVQLSEGMQSFKGTIENTSSILDKSVNMITALESSVDTCLKSFSDTARTNCAPAKSMYDALKGLKVANPIPTTVTADVKSLSTQFDQIEGNRQIAMNIFLAIGPILMLVFFLYILSLQLGSKKHENGCFQCCVCASLPLSFLYFFFLWFFAFLLTLFGMIFADFCIEDPIARLVAVVNNPTMEYFFTCNGMFPKELATVFEAEQTTIDLLAYIGGLELAITKSGDANCQSGINFSSLKSGLTGIAGAASDAVDLMRCKTLNQLLAGVFYEGMCTSLVSGFASLVCAFSFIAAWGLVLMCLYRKFRKSHAAYIAPEPEDEEKKLMNFQGEEIQMVPLGDEGVVSVPMYGQPNFQSQPVGGLPPIATPLAPVTGSKGSTGGSVDENGFALPAPVSELPPVFAPPADPVIAVTGDTGDKPSDKPTDA